MSIASSKYHLLTHSSIERRQPLAQDRRGLGVGDVEPVGDVDAEDRDHPSDPEPLPVGEHGRVDRGQRRVGEDRVEELGDHVVDPGDLD